MIAGGGRGDKGCPEISSPGEPLDTFGRRSFTRPGPNFPLLGPICKLDWRVPYLTSSLSMPVQSHLFDLFPYLVI